jgi:hypothetical protein
MEDPEDEPLYLEDLDVLNNSGHEAVPLGQPTNNEENNDEDDDDTLTEPENENNKSIDDSDEEKEEFGNNGSDESDEEKEDLDNKESDQSVTSLNMKEMPYLFRYERGGFLLIGHQSMGEKGEGLLKRHEHQYLKENYFFFRKRHTYDKDKAQSFVHSLRSKVRELARDKIIGYMCEAAADHGFLIGGEPCRTLADIRQAWREGQRDPANEEKFHTVLYKQMKEKRNWAEKLEKSIMKKLNYRYHYLTTDAKRGAGRPKTGAIHKIIKSEYNEMRKQIKRPTSTQRLKKVGVRRPPGSVALYGKKKASKKASFRDAYIVRFDSVSCRWKIRRSRNILH